MTTSGDDDIYIDDIEFPYNKDEYKIPSYNIPSPKRIYNEVSKTVIGQHEAKQALSIVAYNHLLRYKRNAVAKHLALPPRLTLFIMGPTGTGKSIMCQSLCEYLQLPYFQIDATQLCSPGNSGDDIIDKLKTYYTTNRHNDNYNYGVIYIDEMDKLFTHDLNSGSHNDGYYSSLVYSLLTAIDGTHNEIYGLDTSKLLFIFSGAFEYATKSKGNKANAIGFKSDLASKCKNTTLTREDIEENSGIPRELLARINVITQTFPLEREEIKEILLNCHNAIVPQFEASFLLSGSKLELTDKELELIIEKVYGSKYGMRHNKTIIFEYLKDKMFDLEG